MVTKERTSANKKAAIAKIKPETAAKKFPRKGTYYSK